MNVSLKARTTYGWVDVSFQKPAGPANALWSMANPSVIVRHSLVQGSSLNLKLQVGSGVWAWQRFDSNGFNIVP